MYEEGWEEAKGKAKEVKKEVKGKAREVGIPTSWEEWKRSPWWMGVGVVVLALVGGAVYRQNRGFRM